MKHSLTLVAASLAAGISGLSLWRAKTLAEREVGVLAESTRRMASDWEGKKVPLNRRVVNFIIGDSRAGDDPFALPAEPDWSQTVSDWVTSRVIGGRAASDSTTFVRPFQEDPNAVVWTHDGFSAVTPEGMTREIEKAVKIANEAQAEVNILAQGEAGAAALEALRRLQEVRPVQGVPVGANKVVLVGMSWPRLKKIPWVAPYDFSKLGNVLELMSVYSGTEMNRQTRVEFAIPRGLPGRNLQDAWPQLAGGGAGPREEIAQVKRIFDSPEPLEKLLAGQEQALRDEAAKKESAATLAMEEAARKAEELRISQEDTARKEEEVSRRQEEARQAAQAAPKKPSAVQSSGASANGDAPNGASQGQKDCAQCCTALGGSWRWGNEARTGDIQARYGCCQGADWPQNYSDIPACRSAHVRSHDFNIRLRCTRQ